MKKYITGIFSILYIIIMGYISYSTTPEITRELFNDNIAVLFGIGFVFNGLMLFISIWVMAFIFRIIYKIATKKTLDSTYNRNLTYILLMPIFATHAITLLLINVFSINNPLVLLLFLNPIIFILQYKSLGDEIKKNKIICIIPFILYSLLDMINIYIGLFTVIN